MLSRSVSERFVNFPRYSATNPPKSIEAWVSLRATITAYGPILFKWGKTKLIDLSAIYKKNSIKKTSIDHQSTFFYVPSQLNDFAHLFHGVARSLALHRSGCGCSTWAVGRLLSWHECDHWRMLHWRSSVCKITYVTILKNLYYLR